MRFLRYPALLFLLFSPMFSFARYVVSEAEKALLPEYCKYAQTDAFGGEDYSAPSAGAKKQIALLGESHWHNHHYCYGQVVAVRAFRAKLSKTERDHLLENAVSEADYMIQHSQKNYILLPEIWTFRGSALLRLKKNSSALESFDRAISIDRTYAPAYARKADLMRSAGDVSGAKAVLEAAKSSGAASAFLDELAKELSSSGPRDKPKV
jgi:tetratricopeptide (TPR) repeat protein